MASKRYELKFLLSAPQKGRFLEEAIHGLLPDPHGRNATYQISSLYFDSSDLRAYWDKLDGVALRRKYRLRRYATVNGQAVSWGPAFMEIKHRYNNTIYKERVALTRDGVQAVLDDASQLADMDRFLLRPEPASRSTVDAIRRAALQTGFQSVAVVSYQREAWIGSVDRRLRLTFDNWCRADLPRDGLSADLSGGLPIVWPGRYVMEIKFDHAIPCWVRDIVVAQGLQMQRFSKYAGAVETLGQAPPARVRKSGRQVVESRRETRGETSPNSPPAESVPRINELVHTASIAPPGQLAGD